MTINHTVVEFVAQLAPWLAPLPTAWLVGERTVRHLGWPVPVAAVAGAVVETVGISAMVTALELSRYNDEKNKSEPGAPASLAFLLSLVYFAAALTLTVVLDIAPQVARYAPGIFPVLSLVAMALLALRAGQAKRVADNEVKRERRKRQRRERKPDPPPANEPETFAPDPCAFCSWSGKEGGYGSPQAATNARNAHMSRHKGEDVPT